MFKSKKRWALCVMALLMLGLAACAGLTYVVDPFEQYRESANHIPWNLKESNQ